MRQHNELRWLQCFLIHDAVFLWCLVLQLPQRAQQRSSRDGCSRSTRRDEVSRGRRGPPATTRRTTSHRRRHPGGERVSAANLPAAQAKPTRQRPSESRLQPGAGRREQQTTSTEPHERVDGRHPPPAHRAWRAQLRAGGAAAWLPWASRIGEWTATGRPQSTGDTRQRDT